MEQKSPVVCMNGNSNSIVMNSIQIMNVNECNGTNIFMRLKMKCSIQRGPSWMVHFIFHQMKIFVPLHEWENIYYLFYITCTKIQILNAFKRKSSKKQLLAQAKHFTSHTSNSMRKVLRGRLRHAKRTHCTCCICTA